MKPAYVLIAGAAATALIAAATPANASNLSIGFSSIQPVETYSSTVYTTGPAYTAPAQPYCREYTNGLYIGGRYQPGYGTACLQPDGSWQNVSSGVNYYRPVAPVYTTPQIYAPAPVYAAPVYAPPRLYTPPVYSFNFGYSDWDGPRRGWRGHNPYHWRGYDHNHGRHGDWGRGHRVYRGHR